MFWFLCLFDFPQDPSAKIFLGFPIISVSKNLSLFVYEQEVFDLCILPMKQHYILLHIDVTKQENRLDYLVRKKVIIKAVQIPVTSVKLWV